jgi:hypothetical protein
MAKAFFMFARERQALALQSIREHARITKRKHRTLIEARFASIHVSIQGTFDSD